MIQTFKKFLPANYIDQLKKLKIKGLLYEQLNIYFKSFIKIEFNEINQVIIKILIKRQEVFSLIRHLIPFMKQN